MKLIFELNEFNLDLMQSMAKGRPNLEKVLKFYKTQASIPDDYFSGFLEPWSQWVSIHSGNPSRIHQVMHLGMTESHKFENIWDKEPEKFNLIWGSMNVKRPKNPKLLFFPDPWNTSVKTNIKNVRVLESFLKEAVKNRGNTSVRKIIYMLKILFLGVLVLPKVLKNLSFPVLRLLFREIINFNLNSSIIYAIVEFISLREFLTLAKKTNTSSTNLTDIFFANFIAHFQHYYWNESDNSKLVFAYDLLNEFFREIFNQYDKIVIINGLSQEPSIDEETWHAYYPKVGWEDFIASLKLPIKKTYPLMSYDAILVMESNEDLNTVIEFIDGITTEFNSRVFFTKKMDANSNKLFIRFDYFFDPNIKIFLNKKILNFNDLFLSLGVRTAKHVQYCDVLSSEKITFSFKNNWELARLYLGNI